MTKMAGVTRAKACFTQGMVLLPVNNRLPALTLSGKVRMGRDRSWSWYNNDDDGGGGDGGRGGSYGSSYGKSSA